MKNKQVLFASLISCVLLLGACKKNNPNNGGDDKETPVNHKVTKEQYDECITNYGFAIDKNVTYSGTVSIGVLAMPATIEVDNNVFHTKMVGAYGIETYSKFDKNSIDEEGNVDYEAISYEGAETELEYYHHVGSMPLKYIITESTYMVFIDFDKFNYNLESESYVLSEALEVDAPESNMLVSFAELKFNDGELYSSHFKYSSVANPAMALECNLTIDETKTTSVEFPVIKEVTEHQYNRNVIQRVFFDYKNANATIDAEIDDRGEKINKNIKFDGVNVEIFETVVGGDSSHNYVVFEKDSHNSSTDEIEGLMYYENSDGKTWYSMPYTWVYNNYLTVLTYLIPVEFSKVEYVDETYKTKEAFDYTIGGTEFTVTLCTYSFRYAELNSYSLLAYEKGHLDEEEYKLSVNVTVSDYQTTTVTIPA